MTSEKRFTPDLKDESVGDTGTANSASPDYMQMFADAKWLRFPSKAEAEFIAGYQQSTIKITRWAFVAGFAIYAVFGIVDIYVAPISLRQVWMIRFGIGCPVLALMIMCTYIKRLYP